MIKDKFYRGNYSNKFNFKSYMSSMKAVDLYDFTLANNINEFIDEFSYNQFGNWNPFIERKNIKRNLIFLVIKDFNLTNEFKENVIFNYGDKFLFGIPNSTLINNEFPNSKIETNMMFIANQAKTKFTIKKFNSNDEFIYIVKKLNIDNQAFEREFNDPLYNEMKLRIIRTKYLFVISLLVICFTFCLIIYQSNKCINHDYIKPYALNNNI